MRTLLNNRAMIVTVIALVLASPLAHGGTVRYLGLDIASQPQEDIFARWEAESGHTLQKTYFGLADLVENVERDIKIDNLFDVYQTWVPVYDLASQGHLMDLTDDVKDPQFEWSSIPPAARDWLTTYQDRVYGIPVDADPLVLYYRRDLISEPPVSWEGLIETAKQYHGQDLNGDGTPDYGTCIITEGQAAMYAFLIGNTVMSAQGSRREHFLFDANDDDTIPMSSNMRTAGWEYAMDILRQLYEVSQGWGLASGFGPENAYAVFKTGRCATMLSFPSAGSWTAEAPNGTFMRTRLGVTRTPGSSKIYDRATNTMKTCTPDTCKFMEYGGVNRPGFVAGAVNLIINSDSPNREAAASFAAYFSVHADVRRPGALNPYRNSHWNATWYTELEPVAWDQEDARQYTSALYDTMTGNAVSYPRLPGNDVLAARVEAAMKECMRFQTAPYNTSTRSYSEVLAEMETKIFEELLAAGYTRRQTEQNWRVDVGLPPLLDPPAAASFPVVGIVFIVFVVILILIGVAVFIKFVVLKNANAPKTGSMAIIFAGPRQATELWDNHPEKMEEMTQHFAKAVHSASASSGCYPVKRVGDAHMIAAKTPEAALQLVVNLSKTLHRAAWTLIDEDQEEEAEEVGSATMRSTSRHERESNRSTRSASSHRSARSDRASVYSKGSRVSRATGEHVPTQFLISIGVQYGHCTAHLDTLTERFDYHGTTVDDAARCADAAAPGQILITEDVFDAMSSTVADAFTLKQFSEKKLNSGNKVLHQVDVRGVPRRRFKVEKAKADEEGNSTSDMGGDSIFSALELESTGITSKRITVLSCRFRGMTSASAKVSKDTFATNYTKFIEELHLEVNAARGHIHSLLGDDTVITFGANSNCSSQIRRAVQTSFALQEIACEMKVGIEFKSSIVSGMAQVGLVNGEKQQDPDQLNASRRNNPAKKSVKYNAVVSPILAVGQALLGISCQHQGISCVTTAAMKDDLNTFAYSQAIDIVDIPNLQPQIGAVVDHRPQIILGVMCERSNNAADEWMYELQTQEGADPFALVNLGFEALFSGDTVKAQELLEKHHARATKEKGKETASMSAEDNLKNHIGLNNLESVLRKLNENSDGDSSPQQAIASAQSGYFSAYFF